MEYIKSRINFIAISFYFVVAFSFSVLLLGLENMSFTEIDWIFHGKDMTHHYVGWSYFKNDIWRFPPGSNPIYGLENGSSIVYSDAIPLLAFFFKLFKNYLPNNFQYFSFWIFLCFFFQGFISFKLINHYTNNIPYSLIGSFFFLISPILIYRISFHLALGAHWLIILSFYIQTFQSQKFKNILWGILIASSLLIHFYIAASCIIIFGIFFIEEIFTKKNLIYSLKKIFVFLLIIFLTMYFSGYFMMSTIQTLGAGYGNLKLNLLGIFDPYHLQSPVGFDSWSLFLPDLPSKTGEHEGFSYLGFGIILLLFFCGYLFYLNFKYKKKLLFKIYKKKIYIYIFLFFLFLSLSNNIDFGNYELLHLEINKYVYGYNNDKLENIVAEILSKKKLSISIAESCTGGYLSKVLTDIPGSSKYFNGSVVAYSNDVKENILNIDKVLLKKYGAVSKQVALEMAQSIKTIFKTDIGVSTTGISGPGGGSADKPVGTIYICIIYKEKKIIKKFHLIQDRDIHRKVAVQVALNIIRLSII